MFPRRKNILIKAFLAASLATFVFALPIFANATEFRFIPGTESVHQNELLKVDLFVDNNNTPINAISGKIKVPLEYFQFNSFSVDGSIISFWVIEPGYDNNQGIVSFEGIVLSEVGFRERSGKVFSMTLVPLMQGEPKIEMVSGLILAHDGRATNILSALTEYSFNVSEPKDYDAIQESYQGLESSLLTSQAGTLGQLSKDVLNRSITPFEVISSWSTTIAILIIGSFITYILAHRKHPKTSSRTYKESLKKSRTFISGVKGISSRKLINFFSPIIIALFIATITAYAIYVNLGFTELIIRPIIEISILYFLVLLTLHLVVYIFVLYLVYKVLGRKKFVGPSFFWGVIVGGIIILSILFSGYSQYEKFFRDSGQSSEPLTISN